MTDRYILDFTSTLDGGKAAAITDTVSQCGVYLYSDRDSLTFGMVEQQSARIASLESERDQLRAEVGRLRTPLTDERICELWSWSATAEAERTATTQQHAFARAIEAAKEPQR